MSIPIYLLGVCISAFVWFVLIKVRTNGFYLPFPGRFGGNLLDPINEDDRWIDWNLLMLGWVLMSVGWVILWPLLIFIYAITWTLAVVAGIWGMTIGNEELARKIFGRKK